MRAALVVVFGVGCASAAREVPLDADPADAPGDAAPGDAAIDAPVDGCQVTTTQLLVNPQFDLAPLGTGWTEQRITPNEPLIRADGITEDSVPNMAWLGGLVGNGVVDALTQEIVIPAQTTALVLTGRHAVITQENPTTMQFDTASVSLVEPTGALIALALSLSNAATVTPWSAFTHAFTQDLSGRTVRLRLTSRNDSSNKTSFYFDTLALTATHGCP